MMDAGTLIPLVLACCGVTFALGWLFSARIGRSKIASAREEAKKIVDDAGKEAETLKREKLLEVKDEWYKKKKEFDLDVSVTTALIGIAVDQGKLNLEDRMISFFPDIAISQPDPKLETVTVKDLVMMANGLESLGFAQDEGTLQQMEASEDFMKFAVDRKVVTEPGTQFVYDSPGMHILSGILQQATGMTEEEYARQVLFGPLGIEEIVWPVDPQGYTHGWGDLHLFPRDAAKIGYLWLYGGLWEGDQLISADWVKAASQTQIQTGMDDTYSYGWWISEESNTTSAMGRGGQYIKVEPNYNAVVVATGAGCPDAKPRASPDGKWEAFVTNFNVAVREAGAKTITRLSTDGSEANCYELDTIAWAPDSKKLAAYRVRPGYRRLVHYVESSPEDQLQPKYSTRFYAKQGDVVDLEQPVIFTVEDKSARAIDNALFPNPYDLSRLEWRKDSSALTFEYNQRGHQVFRIIEANAATGAARAVISEEPKTFFTYSGKKYRHDVADGREDVWMSERDGWNHLYLIDGVTGAVKNQITKADWVVRGVSRVDDEKRQIWFRASGMYKGQDPYFVYYYRIDFDGSGLTRLTEAQANHAASFSEDGSFFVDVYSRVDQGPVSELRRAADGSLAAELERVDLAALVDILFTRHPALHRLFCTVGGS